MTRDKLVQYCLSKPKADSAFPFDDHTLCVRVGGKMFALCDINSTEGRINLKCDPELSVDLRASFPSIVPGYHMNKEHWNTLTLPGGLPDDLVRSLADRSYELVLASLSGKQREAAGLMPKTGKTSAKK